MLFIISTKEDDTHTRTYDEINICPVSDKGKLTSIMYKTSFQIQRCFVFDDTKMDILYVN